MVTQPGNDAAEEVPLGAALGFTVAGGVAGIVVALIVERMGRGSSTFIGVCAGALLLYGIVPFTAAEETTTAIWLNVMHVAAALPIVGLLARSIRKAAVSPA